MVELVIKINENEVNKECGLCGSLVNLRKGPQLFRADNWRLVCYSCGEEHNPELCHVIPGVRGMLDVLGYLEETGQLREFVAKGGHISDLRDNPNSK